VLRNFLFGLACVAMTTPALASSNAILLACQIDGAAPDLVPSFTSMICDEAAAQLGKVSGSSVQIVGVDALATDETKAWLRLDVAISSAYTAHGRASWGGGGLVAGEGPELEAGIDDARLNPSTAALLVKVLLADTPFLTEN
jgi:hypothetical protein